MYDTDKTGKESARKQEKQLEEFSVKRLLLPLSGTKEEKDISDYFKAGNTREDFLKLFIEFLDNLYSDTLIMLKSCEIDFNNPPVKAQVIISAGDVPLGTQGNLFGITGGEGTGKVIISLLCWQAASASRIRKLILSAYKLLPTVTAKRYYFTIRNNPKYNCSRM